MHAGHPRNFHPRQPIKDYANCCNTLSRISGQRTYGTWSQGSLGLYMRIPRFSSNKWIHVAAQIHHDKAAKKNKQRRSQLTNLHLQFQCHSFCAMSRTLIEKLQRGRGNSNNANIISVHYEENYVAPTNQICKQNNSNSDSNNSNTNAQTTSNN